MPFAPDLDFAKLASFTEGFSGAEIVALCQEAALSLLRSPLKGLDALVLIEMAHFEQALLVVKPRTSQSMLHFFEEYQKTHSKP